MGSILLNILWICLIIFVIALIVTVVQFILILLDMRQMSKQAKKMVLDIEKKVMSIASILDIATVVLGGMESAKRRVINQAISKSNWAAIFAGLRKGIKVLLGGEKNEKSD